MSSLTHSCHVFLPLPRPFEPSTFINLQADTQFSASMRSTCPNHLILPPLTTTETLSIPKRSKSSSLDFLSFSDTPDIHLIIIHSVLSSLFMSSTFIAHVSLPYIMTL